MAKTEVLPLEKNETIQGLIQKMRETTAHRVIIFSDTRAPLLRSEINLRLLKFYSEEEGKELSLVIKDKAVKRLAGKLGIELDDSLKKPETEPRQNQLPIAFEQVPLDVVTSEVASSDTMRVRYTDEQTSSVPPHTSKTGRLTLALLFTVLSFLAGSYLLFKPRVTLIVYPAYKDWSFSVQGEAGLDFSERDMTKNLIPTRLIEKQGEVVYTMSTTGKKKIGDKPARGMVRFINNSTNPIVVPKGTMVSTQTGFSFATTRNVIVPKKSTEYLLGIPTGEVYGQADVEVEATEKGTLGNVGQKSITRIIGHLAKSLRVINPRDFTTGADRLVSVVQESDIAKAEEEARRQMQLKTTEEIKKLVDQDYMFLPELVETTVQNITPDPPVGQESSTVTVKLSYKVQAAIVSKSNLYKCLQYNLNQGLPEEFLTVTNDIALKSLKVVGGDLHRSKVELQATAKIRGRIDKRKIMSAIAGKPLEEAKEALVGFSEIGRVEFRAPGHSRMIPKYSFQVRMVFPTEK